MHRSPSLNMPRSPARIAPPSTATRCRRSGKTGSTPARPSWSIATFRWMVARCAPPERYFGFIDALFQGQNAWARPEVDHEQALGRIAKLGGISDDKFQSCIKDEKMADAIAASRVVAEKEYGVESTPTFFINGSKMVGEQSYEAFEKALTAAQPKT